MNLLHISHQDVCMLSPLAKRAKASYGMVGKLYLSKTGYLLLSVPNSLVRGAFDALDEPGIELPLDLSGRLDACCTIMRPEELEQLGGADKVTERGRDFCYRIGRMKTVVPSGWLGISKAWILEVRSPELRKLRKTYGLTPLPYNNEYSFYITVAGRKKGVLYANDISKTEKGAASDLPATWSERISGAPELARDDGSLPPKTTYTVQGLWGSRGESLSPLVRLSGVFQGHEQKTAGLLPGKKEQRPWLFAKQLLLGYRETAGEKQAEQPVADISRRDQGAGGMGRDYGDQLLHDSCEDRQVRLDHGKSANYSSRVLAGNETTADSQRGDAFSDRVGRNCKDVRPYSLQQIEKGIALERCLEQAEKTRQPAGESDKQAAIGIPDRTQYGELSKLQPGQLIDFIAQLHEAQRAGRHYDLRMGTPTTGLYSWATKKELPKPGERIGIFRQPLHSFGYKDFQGTLKGYGAGTVRTQDKGQILITKATPKLIEFTQASKRHGERFVLVKPDNWKENDWLLINVTPRGSLPYQKTKFTKIPAEEMTQVLDKMQPGSSLEAKVDGAHTLVELLDHGVEITSYRTSKAGRPIVHTERVFGGKSPEIKTPRELVGSVLRGELYGTRGGKPIPPQTLGGLLNARLGTSLATQQETGTKLRNMLFDVQQVGKTPVDLDQVPRAKRREWLRKILPHLPQDVFHLSEAAETPEEAKALWERIRGGSHPLTAEGAVLHPPTGRPAKAKLLEESDVHITGVFPGAGKYTGEGAGGFGYSLVPDGEEVGRTGTGLTDELRREMLQDPETYVGRVARIRSQGQFPSGAHRSPALIALHENYPDSNDGNTKVALSAKEVARAAAKADTDPTEAQKEVGNYAKGHIWIHGMDVSIENAKGSTRSGTSPDGKTWSTKMKGGHYGYIRRTEGADDDQVDVLVGEHPECELVFVVNQVDPKSKSFDERKVMLGFLNEEEARKGYLACYEPGWAGLGEIVPTTIDQFKEDLASGNPNKPYQLAKGKVKKSDHVPTVGVDFDGTIAQKTPEFEPDVSKLKPRPNARKWLRKFQDAGARTIIFTTRDDDQAIKDWCHEHDIPIDYINVNPNQPPDTSGKIIADVYWDDRAVDAAGALDKSGPEVLKRLEKAAIDKGKAITPVIKKTRIHVEKYDICPHCKEEIHEKGYYVDDEGYRYHRGCLEGGPIGKDDQPEWKGTSAKDICDVLMKESGVGAFGRIAVKGLNLGRKTLGLGRSLPRSLGRGIAKVLPRTHKTRPFDFFKPLRAGESKSPGTDITRSIWPPGTRIMSARDAEIIPDGLIGKARAVTLGKRISPSYASAPGGLDKAVELAQKHMKQQQARGSVLPDWNPERLYRSFPVVELPGPIYPGLLGPDALGMAMPSRACGRPPGPGWAAISSNLRRKLKPSVLKHELTHLALQPYNFPKFGPLVKFDPKRMRAFNKRIRPSAKRWEYFWEPEEFKAFLAEVKRDYVRATGRHIDTPQEATRALRWWRKHKYSQQRGSTLDTMVPFLLQHGTKGEKQLLIDQLLRVVSVPPALYMAKESGIGAFGHIAAKGLKSIGFLGRGAKKVAPTAGRGLKALGQKARLVQGGKSNKSIKPLLTLRRTFPTVSVSRYPDLPAKEMQGMFYPLSNKATVQVTPTCSPAYRAQLCRHEILHGLAHNAAERGNLAGLPWFMRPAAKLQMFAKRNLVQDAVGEHYPKGLRGVQTRLGEGASDILHEAGAYFGQHKNPVWGALSAGDLLFGPRAFSYGLGQTSHYSRPLGLLHASSSLTAPAMGYGIYSRLKKKNNAPSIKESAADSFTSRALRSQLSQPTWQKGRGLLNIFDNMAQAHQRGNRMITEAENVMTMRAALEPGFGRRWLQATLQGQGSPVQKPVDRFLFYPRTI